MSYLELFLLALGLCFDTFAVSLSGGICLPCKPKVLQILKIIFCFALFQSGLTFIGWLLGVSVSSFIERFDHWFAFVLLLYIGGKMIYEGCSKVDDSCPSSINLLKPRKLVLLSIATSIDALAVGISLAIVKLSGLKMGVTMGMIFIVTSLASLVGLLGGRSFGHRVGKRSELLGGLILIGIGVKILIEHLNS